MRTFLKHSRSVGLCLSRQRAGIVRLRRAGARWRLETFKELELPGPLFDNVNADLRSVLKELTAELAKAYAPMQVALPDPAVRAAVFELEELPKSAAAQTSLVQFRFGREMPMAPAALTVSQSLGQTRSQPTAPSRLGQLLFGMSLDNRWHEALQAALSDCGVAAWGIAPSALQRFNLFHEQFAAASGALLSVDRASWALLLWDERTRLRHCCAHWRTPTSGQADEDHQALISEVVRAIVAYADAHPEHTIDKMFVAAAGETEALATLLDRRAKVPCIRLSATDLVDGCDDSLRASHTGEGALCAALSL